MLTGCYENSIDTKGRLVVPAYFRDQLGSELVLTHSDTKCLRVYSKEEFDSLYQRIAAAKKEGRPGVKGLITYFVSPARSIQCDSQGRLSIPAEMRNRIELERDAVTVGCIDHVEIWNKEEYSKIEDNLDEAAVQEAIDYVGAR